MKFFIVHLLSTSNYSHMPKAYLPESKYKWRYSVYSFIFFLSFFHFWRLILCHRYPKIGSQYLVKCLKSLKCCLQEINPIAWWWGWAIVTVDCVATPSFGHTLLMSCNSFPNTGGFLSHLLKWHFSSYHQLTVI